MRGKVLAITLSSLFALQIASPDSAEAASTTFVGCLDCYVRTLVTIARDSCVQVGHEETGWTSCTEETIGLGRYCSLAGAACYNVEVGGGGGGSGGGGGGSACSIGSSGVCPAECFSCERDPNRI